MSIKEEYFHSEEDAALCARKNGGIHFREDWKTLPTERASKAWTARYGPGIEPPPPVAFAIDPNQAALATMAASIALLQSQIADLNANKSSKSSKAAKFGNDTE